MKDKRNKSDELISERAMLFERLLYSGHILEKLVFLASFGLLCFLAGFGLAKKIIKPSKPFIEASDSVLRSRSKLKKKPLPVESSSVSQDTAEDN